MKKNTFVQTILQKKYRLKTLVISPKWIICRIVGISQFKKSNLHLATFFFWTAIAAAILEPTRYVSTIFSWTAIAAAISEPT
jgi:hypothetical protein